METRQKFSGPAGARRGPLGVAAAALGLLGVLVGFPQLALAGAIAPPAGAASSAAPSIGSAALIPAHISGAHLEATVPGSALVSAQGAGARGVLIALPPGTGEVTLESAAQLSGDAHWPLDAGCVALGPRMILRGRPVLPLAIREPSARRQLAAPGARLAIRLARADGESLPPIGGRQRLAAGGAGAANHRGVYLIIATPEFAGVLEPLVAWKTRMGYEVHLATTNETGTTREAIHAYIQTAYETWEQPPLYLLLVGDADGELNLLPSWDVSGNVSDHPYACVDGEDFLPDLYVGRLPAKYPNKIELQVAKTIAYESAPDTTGDAEWFTRALLAAGNYNASTPVPLNRWIAEELRAIGYTQTDSVYWSSSDEHPWYHGEQLIQYFVDQGVSIISYRGWARGDAGWEPPTYTDDEVRELQNGWRMPVVFSIVCHTGNFGNVDEDCFGEVWMKTGTVEEPHGAVGFVGTGEHWSHSRWNDRIAMGIFQEICHVGERRLGPVLAGAKLRLIEHFPTELTMEDAFEDPEESVEYYMYTYNLLGDPSLEIWTARPQPLALEVLEAPTSGRNFTRLAVTDEAGTPVAGAHVALSQGSGTDTELVGYGLTDAAGVARVEYDPVAGDTLAVQVTATNHYPLADTLVIAAEEYALTPAAAEVGGGGTVLPGATAEVTLTVANTGTAPIEQATLDITGPGDDTTRVAHARCGPLSPGESRELAGVLEFPIPAGTADGARLRYSCWPAVGGVGDLPASQLVLTAAAPRFVCRGMSDGGDDVFDPGETVALTVTLANQGSVAAGALTAELAPAVPELVTMSDSLATFAEIAPGGEAGNTGDPFVLEIGPQVAGGTVIPLDLEITCAQGPVMHATCNLVVGPHDPSVPVGPDEYGYYSYDSADFDYPGQAPNYAWIECSPTFGGSGTLLDEIYDNIHSQLVPLPFTFTYYGVPYDTIRVSDNGWISFDTEYWYDIRNWDLPDAWGGASMIAPFWDNLDPGIAGSDGIYVWHDEERHCFVVEWSRLHNWEETTDDYQSFEVLLCDPDYYPTAKGDGEIVFQYKQIINDDYTRMYSTVGIEDHTEQRGLVYSFGNQYARGAAPLSAGLAIKFTTAEPVYEPLATETFTARHLAGEAPGAAIEVCWRLNDSRPLAGLELYRRGEGEGQGSAEEIKVHEELLGPGCERFLDLLADAPPAGEAGAGYRYRLVAVTPYGQRRTVGETESQTGSPAAGIVELAAGPLAGGGAEIRLALGGSPLEELAVYDLAGRRVADLRRALSPAILQGGAGGSFVWQGRDDDGRRLPSGVYWLRLRTPHEARRARLLLVR